jgi:hypothetical protein
MCDDEILVIILSCVWLNTHGRTHIKALKIQATAATGHSRLRPGNLLLVAGWLLASYHDDDPHHQKAVACSSQPPASIQPVCRSATNSCHRSNPEMMMGMNTCTHD